MRKTSCLALLALLALASAASEKAAPPKVAVNFLSGEWEFKRQRIEAQSGLPSNDAVYGRIFLKEESGILIGHLYENTTGPAPTPVNRRLIRIDLTSTVAGAFKIALAGPSDAAAVAAAAAAEAEGEGAPPPFFDTDWQGDPTKRDQSDEEEFAAGDGRHAFRTLFEFSLDPAFHGGLVSYDRWHGRTRGVVQLLATTTFSFTLTLVPDPAPGPRAQPADLYVVYAKKFSPQAAQASFWQRYGSTAAILVFFVISKLFRMKMKQPRGVPPPAQRARLLAQKRAQERQDPKLSKAIATLTRAKEEGEGAAAAGADAGGGVGAGVGEGKKDS